MGALTTEDFIQYANHYRKNEGLSIIPIQTDLKKPLLEGYIDFGFMRARKPELLQWQRSEPFKQAVENGILGIGIMTGRASGNLAVIDCETSEEFDFIKSALPHTRLIQSGNLIRKGGHAYVRTNEIFKTVSIEKQVEFFNHKRYINAPPTLHPTGGQYRNFNDNKIAQVSNQELDSVLKHFGIQLTSLEADEIRRRPNEIPKHLWLRLRGYKQEHLALIQEQGSIHAELVKLGFSFQEIHSIFQAHSHENSLFRKWQAGRRDQRQLESFHSKLISSRTASGLYSESIANEMRILKSEVENSVFIGRTGSNKKTLLIGILGDAILNGSDVLELSSRYISERFGMSKDSRRKVLKALVASGWLKPVQTQTSTFSLEGNRYQIERGLFEKLHKADNIHSSSHRDIVSLVQKTENSVLLPSNHPAFHANALGDKGWEILWALGKGNLLFQELLEVTSVSQRTLYNKLPLMIQFGLVRNLKSKLKDGLFQRIEPLDLDRVADHFNTSHKVETRNEWYRRERKARKETIDRIINTKRKQGEDLFNPYTGELFE